MSTNAKNESPSRDDAETVSLDDLERLNGGAFINSLKQGIHAALMPGVYAASYAWHRWVDKK